MGYNSLSVGGASDSPTKQRCGTSDSGNFLAVSTNHSIDGEDMSIDKDQLRELITDVLLEANLHSPAAVELLMLTAAVESNLGTYIKQIEGPALGIFQMEPATEKDLWKNYLEYKDKTADTIRRYDTAAKDDLRWNLGYAILMTRVHYLRIKEPLPPADDVHALALYWKRHYNTPLGKGTVDKAIDKYNEYCV